MELFNYGECKSGPQHNTSAIRWGWLIIYYSYKTIVGFAMYCGRDPVTGQRKGRLVLRRNDWGPTTGKHLGWIRKQNPGLPCQDDVDGHRFEDMLSLVNNMLPKLSDDLADELLAIFGDKEAMAKV